MVALIAVVIIAAVDPPGQQPQHQVLHGRQLNRVCVVTTVRCIGGVAGVLATPPIMQGHKEVSDMPDARLERNDVGATAVEYALMIALIALAIFATVTVLGVNLSGLFSDPTLNNVLSQ